MRAHADQFASVHLYNSCLHTMHWTACSVFPSPDGIPHLLLIYIYTPLRPRPPGSSGGKPHQWALCVSPVQNVSVLRVVAVAWSAVKLYETTSTSYCKCKCLTLSIPSLLPTLSPRFRNPSLELDCCDDSFYHFYPLAHLCLQYFKNFTLHKQAHLLRRHSAGLNWVSFLVK